HRAVRRDVSRADRSAGAHGRRAPVAGHALAPGGDRMTRITDPMRLAADGAMATAPASPSPEEIAVDRARHAGLAAADAQIDTLRGRCEAIARDLKHSGKVFPAILEALMPGGAR